MEEIFYIGSYSNNIKTCKVSNGKIEIINMSTDIENPSYVHINKNVLYAVSETETGGLTGFDISNNSYKEINSIILNENSPCHITTDSKREKIIISNYGSGSIQVCELDKEGNIGQQISKNEYGINSKMHFAEFAEAEKYIYAVDLGHDNIYVYDENMNSCGNIKLESEAGPRHLVISNDHRRIYIVTELSNHIFVYEKKNNEFNLIEKISTLPENNVESFAGAIKISKDNKYIYVTNRGHNSISVFNIRDDGVELVQNISSCGDFPRDITLNATEEYALVANQKSDNITVFKRDKQSGILSIVQEMNLKIESPSCIERPKEE